MNICLLNDSFPPLIDGVSNTVVNYARIIGEKYGHSIVATPRYPGVTDDYPFEVVRYPSLNTTKLVSYRSGYPFSRKTMKKLAAFSPDIIHSHCPVSSTYLARELREVTGAPIILTYHTKFDIDIRRAVKLKLLQEAVIHEIICNIEACDEVWVVNRGAGENLTSLGYRGKYIIMPNGVDIDMEPVKESELAALDAEYGLKKDVPVFLFVGRIMWYKGLQIILDSLHELKKAGQPFKMVFVGSGDDYEGVAECVKKYKLDRDCILTGAIYDRARLKLWYSRADLFLLPSVYDNNPLVIKEAAACSTASVLIRGSSSAEGITDGVNGILVENSVESVTVALRDICRHPERMREFGEKASSDLYFSWNDSIAKAVTRYKELLKEYHSGDVNRHPARHDKTIRLISSIYQAEQSKRLPQKMKSDGTSGRTCPAFFR